MSKYSHDIYESSDQNTSLFHYMETRKVDTFDISNRVHQGLYKYHYREPPEVAPRSSLKMWLQLSAVLRHCPAVHTDESSCSFILVSSSIDCNREVSLNTNGLIGSGLVKHMMKH